MEFPSVEAVSLVFELRDASIDAANSNGIFNSDTEEPIFWKPIATSSAPELVASPLSSSLRQESWDDSSS